MSSYYRLLAFILAASLGVPGAFAEQKSHFQDFGKKTLAWIKEHRIPLTVGGSVLSGLALGWIYWKNQILQLATPAPTTSAQLRKYTPADTDAVMKIIKQHRHPLNWRGQKCQFTPDNTLIIDTEKQVVAFAYLLENDFHGKDEPSYTFTPHNPLWIYLIACKNTRHGHGQQLMDCVQKQAKEENRSHIGLFVCKDNLGAQKFYNRCGFTFHCNYNNTVDKYVWKNPDFKSSNP